jgi:hypothetical protein
MEVGAVSSMTAVPVSAVGSTAAHGATKRGAVGLYVPDTAARVALLAVGCARVGAVGRLVPCLATVIAQPGGRLAVLGNVAN